MQLKQLPIVMAFCLCLIGQFAFADGTASIIIENVTIVGKSRKGQDATVNIIVKDGIIDIVTKDGLPDEPDITSYDANGAALLGLIDVGEPAAFLLLDESPLDNVDILLDTKTHAVFAITQGEIRRNRLLRVSAKPNKPSGWFAYTPPPIALSSNYQASRRWNHFVGKKYTTIFSAAVVLDRTRWASQNDESELQVGDLKTYDGGEIRALRFGVIGIIKKERPWIYTIFGATNAFNKGFDTRDTDDFAWYDYRLDIPVFKTKTLSVGKQKEPISMERTMSMITLPFQERSAAGDALLPSRNVGIVLSGTEFDGRVTWASGIFNDWLDSGGSSSDSSNQFIGRVTGLPMITKDESNLLHLGFGFRLSDAKEGFATASEPEINMSPAFVDTGGVLAADGFDTFNYELSWRKGPMWIASEYTSNKVDGGSNSDYNFSGYHIAASWILTGEMRAYNHKSGSLSAVPISKPVNQGGWGAWEVGFRYSHMDLSDNDIFGGEMDIYSLALNWWLRKDMNFNVNWRYIELDKPGAMGGPVIQGQSSAVVSRVVLILD